MLQGVSLPAKPWALPLSKKPPAGVVEAALTPFQAAPWKRPLLSSATPTSTEPLAETPNMAVLLPPDPLAAWETAPLLTVQAKPEIRQLEAFWSKPAATWALAPVRVRAAAATMAVRATIPLENLVIMSTPLEV